MSSFGRGRGIVPNRYAVPPPVLSTKNGLNSSSSNHQLDSSVVKNVPTTLPESLLSLPQDQLDSSVVENVPTTLPESLLSLPQDDSPKNPCLHIFGETLISLKEEDSLFPVILDVINSPDCTLQTIERMIGIIIDRCMWLPMISRKFSSLLLFLTSHKLYGKEIKCFTFNTLQTFYEDRESLRYSKKYGVNTFRNAVILTGEMYYRYRIGSRGYNILGTAMLDYLNILVDSNNETDLMILAQQLSWSGIEIAQIDSSSMNQLMLTIRTNLTIHSSAYSKISRLYLLLCLELNVTPFNMLSDDIKEFYCNNIGEKSISLIKPPLLELDNHLEYYNSIRKFFS